MVLVGVSTATGASGMQQLAYILLALVIAGVLLDWGYWKLPDVVDFLATFRKRRQKLDSQPGQSGELDTPSPGSATDQSDDWPEWRWDLPSMDEGRGASGQWPLRFREFTAVRQEQDRQGYRRLFFSREFTLYIWYDEPWGDVLGFQLLHSGGDKAITYHAGEGTLHNLVAHEGWYNPTPLIDGAAGPISKSVMDRFETASETLPAEVADVVFSVLRQGRGLHGDA